MNKKTFFNIVHSCAFLPRMLRAKLLVLSGVMEPLMEDAIAATLEQSTKKQIEVVEQGMAEIKHVEKFLRKDVREERERQDRAQEQGQIPTFDNV